MLSSLRRRLLLALFGLAVVGAGSMGTIGWMTREGLVREAEERLLSTATERELSLDLISERLAVDIATLAADRMVGGTLGDLDANLVPGKADFWKTVEHFTAGDFAERTERDGAKLGTPYGLRHARVHPVAVALRTLGGYGDVLLLNKDGRVVYSTNKGPEFGRDMNDPALAAAGLGRLFETMAAGPDDRASFQDYAAYGFAEGRPSAFLGRPVLRKANVAMGDAPNTVRAGYVVIRLTPETFDRVLADREGLGETGQTYAVGADGLLRTNPPLSATPSAGTPAASLGIAGPLDGSIRSVHFERDGRPRIAATASADIFGHRWTVVAEKSLTEALAAAGSIGRAMQIAAAVVLVITLAIGASAALGLTRPIRRPTAALRPVETTEDPVEADAVAPDEAAEPEPIDRAPPPRELADPLAREVPDTIGRGEGRPGLVATVPRDRTAA